MSIVCIAPAAQSIIIIIMYYNIRDWYNNITENLQPDIVNITAYNVLQAP